MILKRAWFWALIAFVLGLFFFISSFSENDFLLLGVGLMLVLFSFPMLCVSLLNIYGFFLGEKDIFLVGFIVGIISVIPTILLLDESFFYTKSLGSAQYVLLGINFGLSVGLFFLLRWYRVQIRQV